MLAKELGHYDPDAMLDGTNPKLLQEWMAYFQINPFGEARQDLRNATNCLAIMGAMGAKKKGGGEFKIDDFMPIFNQEQKSTLSNVPPAAAQSILRQRYGNNRKSGG